MKLFLIIFGLSSGIMVGAGVISLLILVGIIPRMAQLSNTRSFINFYEKILVIGTFLGALISIQNISISIICYITNNVLLYQSISIKQIIYNLN